jgi:hypothetical protein
MAQRKKVKIIKRAERDDLRGSLSEKQKAIEVSDQTAKREAVTVVTEWVREMRRKKIEQATRGFEGLFGRAA